MFLSKQEIYKFQNFIFSWWKVNCRDLPWRHTHDPYKIFVSEMMLQQTQVSRVMNRYGEFLKTYPTVEKLAQAKTSDVLKMWQGMGYNRRALYLLKTAKIVVEQYKCLFPEDEQQLIKLSGLGKYTARALLVFAWKKDVALVDTNVRKIITHFFFNGAKQKEKVIDEIAEQLVPKGKSWEWHQALMDYGAANISNLLIKKSTNLLIKKISFKESDRYFRGRMMDLVRKKDWKQDVLIKEMMKLYGKDDEFYRKIMKKMLGEGLLSHSSGDIITLPE